MSTRPSGPSFGIVPGSGAPCRAADQVDPGVVQVGVVSQPGPPPASTASWWGRRREAPGRRDTGQGGRRVRRHPVAALEHHRVQACLDSSTPPVRPPSPLRSPPRRSPPPQWRLSAGSAALPLRRAAPPGRGRLSAASPVARRAFRIPHRSAPTRSAHVGGPPATSLVARCLSGTDPGQRCGPQAIASCSSRLSRHSRPVPISAPFGVDRLAGQQQLHGVGPADARWLSDMRADDGGRPDRDLRVENRRVAGS